MAAFLTANLGELADHHALQGAMTFSQEGVFRVSPRFTQALAWQVISGPDLTIIDKNGGLNNTSTYIGLLPQKKLGLVVLVNRGRQPATRIGRQILHEMGQQNSEVPIEGADPE